MSFFLLLNPKHWASASSGVGSVGGGGGSARKRCYIPSLKKAHRLLRRRVERVKEGKPPKEWPTEILTPVWSLAFFDADAEALAKRLIDLKRRLTQLEIYDPPPPVVVSSMVERLRALGAEIKRLEEEEQEEERMIVMLLLDD